MNMSDSCVQLSLENTVLYSTVFHCVSMARGVGSRDHSSNYALNAATHRLALRDSVLFPYSSVEYLLNFYY